MASCPLPEIREEQDRGFLPSVWIKWHLKNVNPFYKIGEAYKLKWTLTVSIKMSPRLAHSEGSCFSKKKGVGLGMSPSWAEPKLAGKFGLAKPDSREEALNQPIFKIHPSKSILLAQSHAKHVYSGVVQGQYSRVSVHWAGAYSPSKHGHLPREMMSRCRRPWPRPWFSRSTKLGYF